MASQALRNEPIRDGTQTPGGVTCGNPSGTNERGPMVQIFTPFNESATGPMNPSEIAMVGISRQINWPVWLPVLGILLASMLIRLLDVDRKFSGLSYDSINRVWPLETAEPCAFIYHYGTLPPLLLGLSGATVALLGGWWWRNQDADHLRRRRQAGLFLGLMLAIGPGLLVNGGLKMFWGRPRPIQCQEFGGELVFHSIGEWSPYRLSNSSFPSGHASIAFFLMAPAFITRPNRPGIRASWLLLGIAYGLAMGMIRIVQGGHFLSDILWAGFIVYFVGVILAGWLVRFEE